MLWRVEEEGRSSVSSAPIVAASLPPKFGVCSVRQNREGETLRHPCLRGGYRRPHRPDREKNPSIIFWPGTTSFSIATIAATFAVLSAELADLQAGKRTRLRGRPVTVSAGDHRAAGKRGCRSVSYTYTEPTIFFEFAYDTAKLAREAGLANVFVTNGYMTAEALQAIQPYLDAAMSTSRLSRMRPTRRSAAPPRARP